MGKLPSGPLLLSAPWAEILALKNKVETVVWWGGDSDSKASQEIGRFGCAINLFRSVQCSENLVAG